jgi:hypothetical protein
MGLSGAAIGTYRPQYRPLSAIRYLDVDPLPTRYTLFITLLPGERPKPTEVSCPVPLRARILADQNAHQINTNNTCKRIWQYAPEGKLVMGTGCGRFGI